jgi:hypothetical protein
MALCVQQPFGSKTGLWNMSDPPTDFSHAGSDVSASMGYQYPLPSMGMSSPSMIPSLHSVPQDHTQQPSPPATTKAASPPSRPGSVPSKASKLKRSVSTPNVRPPMSADAAALALSAEKKRNKLGYHRTSVACGKYLVGLDDQKALCSLKSNAKPSSQAIAAGERSGVSQQPAIHRTDAQTAFG